MSCPPPLTPNRSCQMAACLLTLVLLAETVVVIYINTIYLKWIVSLFITTVWGGVFFFFTSWLHLALDASIRPQVPPSHISPQVPTACKPNWSKQPIHSFCFLGWGSWLMTWQRSSMQIANICHIASSTPYIYLLILLNISAYYRLFVGGGQWCMLPCDTVQKKAISRNPHIHSCCFF